MCLNLNNLKNQKNKKISGLKFSNRVSDTSITCIDISYELLNEFMLKTALLNLLT